MREAKTCTSANAFAPRGGVLGAGKEDRRGVGDGLLERALDSSMKRGYIIPISWGFYTHLPNIMSGYDQCARKVDAGEDYLEAISKKTSWERG